jgi:hypothetical protein
MPLYDYFLKFANTNLKCQTCQYTAPLAEFSKTDPRGPICPKCGERMNFVMVNEQGQEIAPPAKPKLSTRQTLVYLALGAIIFILYRYIPYQTWLTISTLVVAGAIAYGWFGRRNN